MTIISGRIGRQGAGALDDGEMVRLEGGEFWMGSEDHYPEERPARRVFVDAFSIDRYPVTNAKFARFVASTGHVTLAEQAPKAEHYPMAGPALLQPGSSLFIRPDRWVPPVDPLDWWVFSLGTSWRRPWGPSGPSHHDLPDHPVVHVCFADARAYARWAGKRLPTEAEWEFAARGGGDRQRYAWGSALTPDGKPQANYWQGRFPNENTLEDGYERTSPVGSFSANGFGLYDMIGNVWEWTADWYSTGGHPRASPCCIARNPRGPGKAMSIDPTSGFPQKVLKGGSHLCAENYCQRYRPAARHPQTVDTSTSHIGFRCAC